MRNQFFELIIMMLAGVSGGVILLVLKHLIIKLAKSKLVIAIYEVIFVIIYGILFYLPIFCISDGAIKYYHILCYVAGSQLVYITINNLITKLKRKKTNL